jgi:hypothetical protein
MIVLRPAAGRALGGSPLLERLEFDRMGGEVGHVERASMSSAAFGVVVGGAADQREAGQRHHRIDGGAAVLHEEALDRRARVEAAGEGRDHAQAARLQRAITPS